jgi:hypothetical protein
VLNSHKKTTQYVMPEFENYNTGKITTNVKVTIVLTEKGFRRLQLAAKYDYLNYF